MTALQITDPVTIRKAEALAQKRGVPAEQALTEIISATYEAQLFFAERARRGNPEQALAILAQLGVGNTPDDSDALP